MNADTESQQKKSVEPFSISVMGGVFSVKFVILNGPESIEEVVATIKGTEGDRWMVMVSEDSSESEDSLALIDDTMNLQVFAYGTLEQS